MPPGSGFGGAVRGRVATIAGDRGEHALQERVAAYLVVALAGVAWWSSIDHGAGRMGGAAAGRRKARGVKPGIPDIVVLHRGRLIGIELKASDGRASPEQLAIAAEWRAQGVAWGLARSLAEVEALLRAEGVLLRYAVLPNGVGWSFCGWGAGGANAGS